MWNICVVTHLVITRYITRVNIRSETEKPKSTTMLPPTAKITPEHDEATILSQLFSKPLMYNRADTSSFKLNGSTVKKPPLLPYEIEHVSSYEADNLDNDSTRLMTGELSYSGYYPNTEIGRNFYVGSASSLASSQVKVVPRIWECVKNAFTMPPG
jgi:hypothetical protein